MNLVSSVRVCVPRIFVIYLSRNWTIWTVAFGVATFVSFDKIYFGMCEHEHDIVFRKSEEKKIRNDSGNGS